MTGYHRLMRAIMQHLIDTAAVLKFNSKPKKLDMPDLQIPRDINFDIAAGAKTSPRSLVRFYIVSLLT